jgi:hypothetical protein
MCDAQRSLLIREFVEGRPLAQHLTETAADHSLARQLFWQLVRCGDEEQDGLFSLNIVTQSSDLTWLTVAGKCCAIHARQAHRQLQLEPVQNLCRQRRRFEG